MTVLILNGSPRAGGNTARAVQELVTTFGAEGIETDVVQLGNKDVRGCIACGSCKKTGKCVFADIVNDIRAISKELNAVKITMNQTIARQMGWDKTAELVEQSAKKAEDINNGVIKLLGLDPIEPENWIRLSKNAGEIKIENTSKESVSSLFAIFMPMLKQHIYYLNNRENELLKEFQQALLPELMSGRLDIDL